ncbi:MAG: Ig domain-containing protein, partial [Clostridiales bacterium]|nr:Ig domain-containing protein [Clostridiales bacterium]
MRTWLNDNFYNTAFTSTEQSDVKTTALDNSAWPGYSQYNSASTNDKLFLLSYSESTNTAYGFSSSTGSSATRYAQGSDYAKCQGLYVNNSPGSDYDKNSVWFLRSPGGNSNRASYAYYNGYVNDYSYNVGDTIIGVCPALKLSSLSSLSTIPVTGVLLGEKSLSLTVAETSQLTAEVSPSDAADKSLTWASSDTNVATVSATGLVTAKAPGTATITVTTNDGGFTDTCAVTVSRINAGSFAVTDIPNQTYTGGELTPPVEVKFNGETLTLGTDYTVEYANNINVGTATATVTGKGNFEGAKAVTFTIVKASASGFAVTAIPNQTYTGGSIKPPVEVKFNGAVLTLGTDYTVEYANNINVGTATVTITGKGNFEGAKAVNFTIVKASASGFAVTAIPNQTYTGGTIKPPVEVKFNGAALTLGTDYTVEYANNIIVGTATVTFTGKGNFEGTKAVTFAITAANASAFTVTDIPDKIHTGNEITPLVEVKFNGAALTLGTDYTVEYTNNINVGTATATITGKGNFEGTKAVTFTIIAASASGFAVTDIPDQTYTGSEITPPVEVKFNGATLTLGTDYTVEYANNINVGTATATVTGKGNFEGAKAVTFTIVKASASGFAVTEIPNQTYTGGGLTPTVEVKFNGAVLTLGTDYTVEYANNINVGTATVTITGKGNFEGTKAVTFTIVKASAGGFAVTEIPNQTYTGGTIKPPVEVKFNGAALTLGTDYTVEYANNINVGTATVTITGKGNFEGAKAVTFAITAANADGFAVTEIPDQTYTGNELTPPVEVKFNGKTLMLNKDYTLEYTNNINIRTATVTITGKGNFEGTKVVTFKILKADAGGFAVTDIPNQIYKGGTIKPPVEVKFNGAALTLGKDYIVEYKDNINVGTATATITGKGNFEGTKAVTFTIIKANAGDFAVTNIPDRTYTGGTIKPPVEVKFNGATLTLGTDYTVEYANNINVGTATVTITGKGNFEGAKAVTFAITAA